MKRYRPGKCCGKGRFATREAAEAEVAHIAAVSTAPKVPVRVYQCHHSWWHMTSLVEAPWETAAKENA